MKNPFESVSKSPESEAAEIINRMIGQKKEEWTELVQNEQFGDAIDISDLVDLIRGIPECNVADIRAGRTFSDALSSFRYKLADYFDSISPDISKYLAQLGRQSRTGEKPDITLSEDHKKLADLYLYINMDSFKDAENV